MRVLCEKRFGRNVTSKVTDATLLLRPLVGVVGVGTTISSSSSPHGSSAAPRLLFGGRRNVNIRFSRAMKGFLFRTLLPSDLFSFLARSETASATAPARPPSTSGSVTDTGAPRLSECAKQSNEHATVPMSVSRVRRSQSRTSICNSCRRSNTSNVNGGLANFGFGLSMITSVLHTRVSSKAMGDGSETSTKGSLSLNQSILGRCAHDTTRTSNRPIGFISASSRMGMSRRFGETISGARTTSVMSDSMYDSNPGTMETSPTRPITSSDRSMLGLDANDMPSTEKHGNVWLSFSSETTSRPDMCK
mmetsp:Transcript_12814/g.34103  ORF Transcript_12814/g.34103 Transcript_12814/m.34103 type:complete len:305 (-) Transcript_12814:751-1665(-)